jgi:hypothetical protein
MSEYIVLPSMDGDPGDTFPNSRFFNLKEIEWICDEKNHIKQYQEAVERILILLEELGLKGKMTWLLNERDVGWTKHYRNLIKDMIKDGYEIGLHTHVGTVFQKIGLESPKLRDDVNEIIKKAKESVEDCTGKSCISHRFGCYYQDEFFYSIIKNLGIRIVSDVNPGIFLRDLEGHILNNKNIPLNVHPWRHDENNWLDYKSKKGHFLHIPVSAASIGEDKLLGESQPEKIENGEIKNITALNNIVEKVKKHSIKYICWHIHPHEIQKLDGTINIDKLEELRDCLEKIENELHPRYMNFCDFELFLEQSNKN